MLIRFFFWILTAVVVLSIAGALYQVVGTANDITDHRPPGDLVEVNGHRLHIHCTGDGSPTVLLEHAPGASSAHWGLIQPALAETTRVCAYDRAGFGWSDSSSERLDLQHSVDDLQALLRAENLDSPIVLAGHGYGGVVARLYASQHPQQVVGLVLIDPAHFLGDPAVPDEVDAVWEGQDAFVQRWGFVLARVGLFRVLGTETGDLPEEQAAAVRGFAASNKQWDAIRALDDAFDDSAEQLKVETRDFATLPLIVLSAGDPAGPERDDWTVSNANLARLSSDSDHRIIEGGDHLGLLIDRGPSAEVTRAILDVVEAARTGASLGD